MHNIHNRQMANLIKLSIFLFTSENNAFFPSLIMLAGLYLPPVWLEAKVDSPQRPQHRKCRQCPQQPHNLESSPFFTLLGFFCLLPAIIAASRDEELSKEKETDLKSVRFPDGQILRKDGDGEMVGMLGLITGMLGMEDREMLRNEEAVKTKRESLPILEKERRL